MIAKLWVFADARHVPALQNKSIDIFARKLYLTGEPITQADGQYILENTVGSSPLRMLVCKIARHVHRRHALFSFDDKFEAVVANLPETRGEAHGTGWKSFKLRPAERCALHVHAEGEVCVLL